MSRISDTSACGTPALGLAVGGARDALADGELGLIATEGTLAEDIIRALSSARGSREDLSAAVAARFGWDAFVQNIRAIMARVGFAPQSVC